jgi:hypothetical protein
MTAPVNLQRRGVVKFSVWAVVATAVMAWTVRSYSNGQMAGWFYHRAGLSGYAVNADAFKSATASRPATLQIATVDNITGLQAVRVEKGALLPRGSNGIISDEVIAKGKRVLRVDATLQVRIPWEIKESKGFKFKDTFKHKGIETWPWAGVWNIVVVALLGLSLGMMAEGFTDMLGLRLEKIRHTNKTQGSHV